MVKSFGTIFSRLTQPCEIVRTYTKVLKIIFSFLSGQIDQFCHLLDLRQALNGICDKLDDTNDHFSAETHQLLVFEALDILLQMAKVEAKIWTKDRNSLSIELLLLRNSYSSSSDNANNYFLVEFWNVFKQNGDTANMKKLEESDNFELVRPQLQCQKSIQPRRKFLVKSCDQLFSQLFNTIESAEKRHKIESSHWSKSAIFDAKAPQIKVNQFKKGLLRNLKIPEGKTVKVDWNLMPFWNEVFKKDFSARLDHLYGQTGQSKGKIVQFFHQFKWCQNSSNNNKSVLMENNFAVNLNFGEVLYCLLLNQNLREESPIYESIKTPVPKDDSKAENDYNEVVDNVEEEILRQVPIPMPRIKYTPRLIQVMSIEGSLAKAEKVFTDADESDDQNQRPLYAKSLNESHILTQESYKVVSPDVQEDSTSMTSKDESFPINQIDLVLVLEEPVVLAEVPKNSFNLQHKEQKTPFRLSPNDKCTVQAVAKPYNYDISEIIVTVSDEEPIQNAKLLSKAELESLITVKTKKRKTRRKTNTRPSFQIPPLLRINPIEPARGYFPKITYFQGSLIKENEMLPLTTTYQYKAGQYDEYLDQDNGHSFAAVQFGIRKELDKKLVVKDVVVKVDAFTITEEKLKTSEVVKKKDSWAQTEPNFDPPQILESLRAKDKCLEDNCLEDKNIRPYTITEPSITNDHDCNLECSVGITPIKQDFEVQSSKDKYTVQDQTIIPELKAKEDEFEDKFIGQCKILDPEKDDIVKTILLEQTVKDKCLEDQGLTVQSLPFIKITPSEDLPILETITEADAPIMNPSTRRKIVVNIGMFKNDTIDKSDEELSEPIHDEEESPRHWMPEPLSAASPVQFVHDLNSVTDEEVSKKDDLEELLEELEQASLSRLELPFTSVYLARKPMKPKFSRFGSEPLEDIQEVRSQESLKS